jgi:hypothetical protein
MLEKFFAFRFNGFRHLGTQTHFRAELYNGYIYEFIMNWFYVCNYEPLRQKCETEKCDPTSVT